ncbi:MAG: hydantoinase B/oxoprolinase family protein, partial [Alphaproteobacteria bacterium]|nr:hydantoinase B/oxoprolinase family protein [Alphaproteobacteria bacterium]
AFIHASDVGGRVPSSISPSNDELFQEGLLIPPLKLMHRGELNMDLAAMIRANCRTPDANLGDMKAMLAALTVGGRRVADMIAQHGLDTFMAAQEDIVAYTAARAREVLRKLPDGTYSFWDYLDDDLATDFPVRVRVTLRVKDGEIEIDYTGTDPQVMASYNIPTHGKRHPWLTLRIAAFICTHDRTIAHNAGLFRHVHIVAPKGSIVNPEFPAAVGVRHATAIRVNDTLNGVLGQAAPDLMPAANGGIVIPVVLAQHDAATGQRHVIVVEPMVGGMGARRGADGVDGRDSGISNLANNPLETVEADVAIHVRDYSLRQDSGGPGQWRGGVGLCLTFEVLKDGAAVLGRGMERMRFQPWGAHGGRPGTPARTILNHGKTNERELGKIDMVVLNAGDTMTVLTPGGGGFGDPNLRDPAAVARDVARGFVSAAAAEHDYGVIIADGRVDVEATQRRRGNRPPQTLKRPIDGGPVRETWEAVFTDARMNEFARRLLALPRVARGEQRKRVMATVMPSLAQGRANPIEAALGEPDRQGAEFDQAIQSLPQPLGRAAE